jgi:colanic acid/amylovoran biosynthesis glycosyltransferase
LSNVAGFGQVVFSEEKLNLDRFPFDPVLAWTDFSRARRLLEGLGQRIFRLPDRYYRLNAAKKHDISLIHSHFGNRGFFDTGLAKALGLKHITTFYGYDATLLPGTNTQWKTNYDRLFDSCDLILAEGPYMRQTILDLGCPSEKAKIQRIGVDLNKIRFKERRVGEDGKVRLLIAGSFVEKKGIPYAIESIGLAYENYKNIEVTVVGDATEVRQSSLKEKERIMNLVKKYDLTGITKFMGYLTYEELLEESYKAHIFVSPSVTAADGDSEGGSPVTITEFAASGMPILSTYHCDIPEVVRHDENGLLAQERDVEGLANNLVSLIKNPEHWVTMGQKGRKRVEENFNLHKQVKLLEQIYNDLLS